MEKRLLLAVALSFTVLYIWSLLTPKPNIKQTTKALQTFENKELIEKEDISPSPPKSFIEPLVAVNYKEETNILDNEKIKIEFSNIGGSLKSVLIKEFDKELPVKNLFDVSSFQDEQFNMVYAGNNKISYILENEDLRIERNFNISLDDYTVFADIEIVFKSEMSKQNSLNITGLLLDMSNLNQDTVKKDPSFARDKSMYEYVLKEDKRITRKNNAYKFADKEKASKEGNVQWLGFRDRYFCAIVKPDFPTATYAIDPINENSLRISMATDINQSGVGDSVRLSAIMFFGPENTALLKSYDLGFEEIKRFYKFNLFDAIAKIIYSILHLLQKIIPNWGLCIVLISVIIYFSMYPLTLRGMSSMKKMQSMQPKIASLKEKHKSNPQKMNKEMMELYKTHKINPLGGCLPFLLQMPVFIGLYQVLWRDVSLKGAGFLWIKDLSAPDRLFLMPFSLPFVGNEFNLLPLIMVVVMAFQQKLTAKNMVVTDPMQLQQQKMMSTIMPVFLGFIFYKFASGLTLYFTMFYIFSTFTQWKMTQSKKAA